MELGKIEGDNGASSLPSTVIPKKNDNLPIEPKIVYLSKAEIQLNEPKISQQQTYNRSIEIMVTNQTSTYNGNTDDYHPEISDSTHQTSRNSKDSIAEEHPDQCETTILFSDDESQDKLESLRLITKTKDDQHTPSSIESSRHSLKPSTQCVLPKNCYAKTCVPLKILTGLAIASTVTYFLVWLNQQPKANPHAVTAMNFFFPVLTLIGLGYLLCKPSTLDQYELSFCPPELSDEIEMSLLTNRQTASCPTLFIEHEISPLTDARRDSCPALLPSTAKSTPVPDSADTCRNEPTIQTDESMEKSYVSMTRISRVLTQKESSF